MGDTSLVFDLMARDRTESGIESMEQNVEESSRQIGDAIEQGSNSAFESFASGAAIAGAIGGAALIAGLAGAMEEEDVGALLAAQTGGDAARAHEYGAMAGDLWASGFGDSVADAGEAIRSVIQENLLSDDASDEAIQQAASRVATLGTLMGEEATAVSRAVSQMLKTGIAQNAEEAFDILARGVQQGVNKSEDLLDTFNEYSIQFKKLGLEGPQALGLMSQAIKAGARDSDTAADALKEFAIRAIDGSDATAEGFRAIGLSAGDMAAKIAAGGSTADEALALTLDRLRAIEDPVARNAAAVALFGTKAEDLGDALLAMDPRTAVASLGEVSGAAQKAADVMGGTAGAEVSKFGREIQQAFTEKMAAAIPYIKDFVGFLSEHKDVIGPITVGLAAMAVALGTATAAQIAFNVAAYANPYVLAAAMIVAWLAWVVTLIYMLVTHWDQVKSVLLDGWDAVKTFFTQTIPGWWNAMIEWVSGLPGKVSAAMQPLFTWFSTAFDSVIGFFAALPGRILAGVMSIPGMLLNLFTTAMTGIAYAVGFYIGMMLGFWMSLPGRIWAAISAIPGVVMGVLNTTADMAKVAAAFIVNGIIFTVTTLPSRAWSAIMGIAGVFSSVLSSTLGMAKSGAQSIVNGIIWAFNNLPSMMYNAGVNALNGLVNGINSLAGYLKDLAWRMAQGFLQGFKDALHIGSPSKVMFDMAVTGIGAGLIGGIESLNTPVRTSAEGLATSTTAGYGSVTPVGPTTGGQGGGHGGMTLSVAGGTSVERAIADMLAQLIRTGMLRLSADGVAVGVA